MAARRPSRTDSDGPPGTELDLTAYESASIPRTAWHVRRSIEGRAA